MVELSRQKVLNWKFYLEYLESCLDIKIPNEIISLLFLSTSDKVLDGECFVDADDDAWGVEDEEHNNSHD